MSIVGGEEGEGEEEEAILAYIFCTSLSSTSGCAEATAEHKGPSPVTTGTRNPSLK